MAVEMNQETPITKYNLYCDESSVDNNLPFFTIGALLLPRKRARIITNEFKAIKSEFGFNRELKWNKVTERHLDMYKKLIDFFADDTDLDFKCILVENNLVNMEHHEHDSELMFYKFYYQLLRRRFKRHSLNYVFTDSKSRRRKLQLNVMQNYLAQFPDLVKFNISIKHLQEYESRELHLLQLSDFFTGAVAYANNYSRTQPESNPKKELVKYIEEKFDINLQLGSNFYFDKFNIFKWKPSK